VGDIWFTETDDVWIKKSKRVKNSPFFNLCMEFSIDVLMYVDEIVVGEIWITERGNEGWRRM